MMRFLTVEEILELHDRVITVSGGLAGVRPSSHSVGNFGSMTRRSADRRCVGTAGVERVSKLMCQTSKVELDVFDWPEVY